MKTTDNRGGQLLPIVLGQRQQQQWRQHQQDDDDQEAIVKVKKSARHKQQQEHGANLHALVRQQRGKNSRLETTTKKRNRPLAATFLEVLAISAVLLMLAQQLQCGQAPLAAEAKIHHSKRQTPTTSQFNPMNPASNSPATHQTTGRENNSWWNVWWQQYINEAVQPTVRPIVAVHFNGRTINLADQTAAASGAGPSSSSNLLHTYHSGQPPVDNLMSAGDIDTNFVLNQLASPEMNPVDLERNEKLRLIASSSAAAAVASQLPENTHPFAAKQMLLVQRKSIQQQANWQSVRPTMIQPSSSSARDGRSNRQATMYQTVEAELPPVEEPAKAVGIQMRNVSANRQLKPQQRQQQQLLPQLEQQQQQRQQQQQQLQQLQQQPMDETRFEQQQQNQMGADYGDGELDLDGVNVNSMEGGCPGNDSSSSGLMDDQQQPKSDATDCQTTTGSTLAAGQPAAAAPGLPSSLQPVPTTQQQQQQTTPTITTTTSTTPTTLPQQSRAMTQRPTADTSTGPFTSQSVTTTTTASPITTTTSTASRASTTTSGEGREQSTAFITSETPAQTTTTTTTTSKPPSTTTKSTAAGTKQATPSVDLNETPISLAGSQDDSSGQQLPMMTTPTGRVELEGGRPATGMRQQATTTSARLPTRPTTTTTMTTTMTTTAAAGTSGASDSSPAASPRTTTQVMMSTLTTTLAPASTAAGTTATDKQPVEISSMQPSQPTTQLGEGAVTSRPAVASTTTTTESSTTTTSTTTTAPTTTMTMTTNSDESGDEDDETEGDGAEGSSMMNAAGESDDSSDEDENQASGEGSGESGGREPTTTTTTSTASPVPTAASQQPTSTPKTNEALVSNTMLPTIDIERLPLRGPSPGQIQPMNMRTSMGPTTTTSTTSLPSTAVPTTRADDIARIRPSPGGQQQQADVSNPALVMMTLDQSRATTIDGDTAITMPMDMLVKMMMMNQIGTSTSADVRQPTTASMGAAITSEQTPAPTTASTTSPQPPTTITTTTTTTTQAPTLSTSTQPTTTSSIFSTERQLDAQQQQSSTTTSSPAQEGANQRQSTSSVGFETESQATTSDRGGKEMGTTTTTTTMAVTMTTKKRLHPPPTTRTPGSAAQGPQASSNLVDGGDSGQLTPTMMMTTTAAEAPAMPMTTTANIEPTSNVVGADGATGEDKGEKIELLNLDLVPIQRIMNGMQPKMRGGDDQKEQRLNLVATQGGPMKMGMREQQQPQGNETRRGQKETIGQQQEQQVVVMMPDVEPGMRLRPTAGVKTATKTGQPRARQFGGAPAAPSGLNSQVNAIYMIMLNNSAAPPSVAHSKRPTGTPAQQLRSGSVKSASAMEIMQQRQQQSITTKTAQPIGLQMRTTQSGSSTMGTTVAQQQQQQQQQQSSRGPMRMVSILTIGQPQTTLATMAGFTSTIQRPTSIEMGDSGWQRGTSMRMIEMGDQQQQQQTSTTAVATRQQQQASSQRSGQLGESQFATQRSGQLGESQFATKSTTAATSFDQSSTTTTSPPTGSGGQPTSTITSSSQQPTGASSQNAAASTTTQTPPAFSTKTMQQLKQQQEAAIGKQIGDAAGSTPESASATNQAAQLERVQLQQQQQSAATDGDTARRPPQQTLATKTGKPSNLTSSFIPSKLRNNFNKLSRIVQPQQVGGNSSSGAAATEQQQRQQLPAQVRKDASGGETSQSTRTSAITATQSPMIQNMAIRQFGGANRMSALANQPVPFGRPAAMTLPPSSFGRLQQQPASRFEVPTFEHGPSIAVRRPDEPLANGQIPNCTLTGKNFCVLTKDYPMNEVRQAVERSFRSVRIMYEELQTVSDQELHKDDFNVTNNQAAGGKFACQTKVEMMRPGWAKDEITREWMLVVNTDVFPQRVRTESCAQPNTPCEFIAPFYDSTCQQRYSLHRMIAIDPHDPSRSPQVAVFKFPAGCVCRVHPIRKTTSMIPTNLATTTPVPTTIISSSTSKSIRRR